MRFRTLAASLALAFSATTAADAALIASGDSNIFGSSGTFTFAPNQQFLRNIAGANVLLQDTNTSFLNSQMEAVSAYLTGQGIANTLTPTATILSAADFAGRSLFIGYAPDNGYTPGEITAMQAFLAGGGTILLTGENSSGDFVGSNAAVNAALAALGGGMVLVPANIDAGFNTANIITANAITAGTAGFQYAATSLITGGTPLYGTLTGNQPFMAFVGELGPRVPEPATWALMIAGFGLAGTALRRRRVSAVFA